MAMAEYFALVKQIDFDYLYTGMSYSLIEDLKMS
jgi:hypothetical protein